MKNSERNQNEIRIVVSGVEGVNKGAELMLYAILEQLERRYPTAIVYLPISQFPEGLKQIKTTLRLRQNPNRIIRFFGKTHITGILNRIGLRFNYLNNLRPIENVKYYLDASGLYFSDQMIFDKYVAKDLNILLQGYHKQGTKIIYLPQAFGPFFRDESKSAFNIAYQFSDLMIARDETSMRHILQLQKSSPKLKLYPDFTSLISPKVPDKYRYLAGRVCVILNRQIIRKRVMHKCEYLELVKTIVDTIYAEGYEAFFLDHAEDGVLVKEFLEKTSYQIPLVKGQGAIAVKGIISQSHICVSSRFHGVVSSFTSGVPCLTTSWNHKYQELLSLYDMNDALLPKDRDKCVERIKLFLHPSINSKLRSCLEEKNRLVDKQIIKMWEMVWSI